MNLLFALNENYLPPLCTLLNSIFKVNQFETHTIYLMHRDIRKSKLEELACLIESHGHAFYAFDCSDLFEKEDKIVNRYYSIEMYYRLLAPFVLPDHLDRLLYLDPDIVNLNSIRDFYYQDFQENMFVATTHDYLTKWIQPINNIRLGTMKSDDYFNTGVILMNLPLIRKEMEKEDIFIAIESNKNRLVLPDQDIFNHLYWDRVLEADWRIYNLDPRYYSKLNLVFPKEYNIDWVKQNVVFIHYCGKHKPWVEKEEYRYDLGDYYHKFAEGIVLSETYEPVLEEE